MRTTQEHSLFHATAVYAPFENRTASALSSRVSSRKKRKLRLFLPALAIFLLASLCACGSKLNATDSIGNPSQGNGYISESPELENTSGEESDFTNKADKASVLTATEKIIIKNAEVDLHVTDVRGSYAKIIDWAKQNSGYEFSQELSLNGDYTSIKAQIKIAPEKLDAFLSYLAQCGDVIHCNVKSDDITSDYLDAELRLKTKRASLDKYYQILAEADNVDEILKVQDVIESITQEIELLEGKLSAWDKLVQESTVTLVLNEKSDPSKVEKEIQWDALSFKDMGWLIARGFTKVTNTIVSFLQWLVIIFTSALPILIILGCVLVAALWIRKRRRK